MCNLLCKTLLQVADFGLAKLTSDNNTHVSTRVMGTFGYVLSTCVASISSYFRKKGLIKIYNKESFFKLVHYSISRIKISSLVILFLPLGTLHQSMRLLAS